MEKEKEKQLLKASSSRVGDNSTGRAGRSELSMDAINVKDRLICRTGLSLKKCTVREILGAYGMHPQESRRLSFRFNLQEVARLSTEGVFASSAGPSSLAYVSFMKIQNIREHHFRGVKRVKGATHPFTAKVRGGLWEIESRHLAEDPYLVAILIALAQDQRQHQQRNTQDTETTKEVALPETGALSCQDIKPKGPGTAQSFKVQVLAIYGTAAVHFYAYTAIISAEFLDKFDKPWQRSSDCPVVVKYRRLAIWAERSLEKLHRVLCPGSCKFCTGNHVLNRRPVSETID